MSKKSERDRAALRDRARRYAETLTDEDDRKLHEAALADPDNPPLADDVRLAPMPDATKAAFAAAQAHARRTRGRQKAPTKLLVSIRLSPEVIDHFRAEGRGWQSRIDEALKRLIAAT